MLARVLLETIEARGLDLEMLDEGGDWVAGSVMGQLKTMKLRRCRRSPSLLPPSGDAAIDGQHGTGNP
jgi:hypothetical protein